MKMEVIAVQQQYQAPYNVLGSNKVKDWTSTLTPPQSNTNNKTTTTTSSSTTATPTNATNAQNNSSSNTSPNLPYRQSNTTNKIKNSINKKSKRTAEVSSSSKTRAAAAAVAAPASPPMTTMTTPPPANLFYCDDIDAAAVSELSLRLLDELRAAKSRHLTCTEVSLPCDLTERIAAEIIRVSEKEPCGIRGCTIYIEFEDEPNNSRRIASLQLDAETVSTFEVYLTLRQDHRGWTALLPQFMKSLARTITISPEFTITKHKLYSPHHSSYSYSSSAAISTPSS